MANIPITLTYKRPLEKERQTFSFKKSLGTGETLSGAPTITAKPAEGLVIEGEVTSSPEIQCLVSGGKHGEKYILTCSTSTTGGQTLHNDIQIEIEKAKTA